LLEKVGVQSQETCK